MKKQLTIITAGLLAGCVSPMAHLRTGEAFLTVQPTVSPYSIQAPVSPYGKANIQHLNIKLFKVANGSETPVNGPDGLPLLRDIPNASLSLPVTFGNLSPDTTYRARAYAYLDAATASLISNAESYVDISLTNNDRPFTVSLPVRLINTVFEGAASTSLNLIEGGYIASGSFGVNNSYRVSTFAGQAGVQGTADGIGTAASFDAPYGITIDTLGNLYLCQVGEDSVRKITPQGVVTTITGPFNNPQDLTVDASGTIYVSDTASDVIRKISPSGEITILAGKYLTRSYADGTGTDARFNSPRGIGVDASGSVYVADTGNRVIRKISPSGVVSTLAGQAGIIGRADGLGTSASFEFPWGLAASAEGTVYVGEFNDHTIRKITPAGEVSTFAGNPGIWGSADGTAASFRSPIGLTVDRVGNVIVGDIYNHLIRKITPSGFVSTIAGKYGAFGTDDGPASSATFYIPQGVAVDASGMIYILDAGNNTIRKLQ